MATAWWRHRTRRRDTLAVAATIEWSRLGMLRERQLRCQAGVERWRRVSAGSSQQTLDELQAVVRTAVDTAERAAETFSRLTPNGVEGVARAELGPVEVALATLRLRLDGGDQAIETLETVGYRIDRLRSTLPSKLRFLALEYQEAEGLLGARRREGWPVGHHERRLHRLHPRIFTTDLSRISVDWTTVADNLDAADADLAALLHDLAALDDRIPSLRRWHDHLLVALAAAEGRVADARSTLAEQVHLHHPESLAAVSAHPQRSDQLLGQSRAIVARAAKLAELGPGDDGATRLPESRLDEAGRAFEEANLLLGMALRLIGEVGERARALELARADAAHRVADCRGGWTDLGALAAAHSADVAPEMLQRPAEVATLLDHLERELTLARPRYLLVVEWCDHLDRELDAFRDGLDDQRRRRVRAHATAAGRVREVRELLWTVRAALRRRPSWLVDPDHVFELEELELRLDQRPYNPASQIGVANEVQLAARRLLGRIEEAQRGL